MGGLVKGGQVGRVSAAVHGREGFFSLMLHGEPMARKSILHPVFRMKARHSFHDLDSVRLGDALFAAVYKVDHTYIIGTANDLNDGPYGLTTRKLQLPCGIV